MTTSTLTDVRGHVINIGDVVLINDDYDFYVRHVKSIEDYTVVTDPSDYAIARRSHEICHASSQILVIKPSMSVYSHIDHSFIRHVVGDIKVGEDVVFMLYNESLSIGKVTFVGKTCYVVEVDKTDFGISKYQVLPLRELL